MKRIRQENAEVYTVTATEIAHALGVHMEDGDVALVEASYGDKFYLTIKSVTREEVPIPLASDPASGVVVLPEFSVALSLAEAD